MELINAISGSGVLIVIAGVSTHDLSGRTGYANIYFFYN